MTWVNAVRNPRLCVNSVGEASAQGGVRRKSNHARTAPAMMTDDIARIQTAVICNMNEQRVSSVPKHRFSDGCVYPVIMRIFAFLFA